MTEKPARRGIKKDKWPPLLGFRDWLAKFDLSSVTRSVIISNVRRAYHELSWDESLPIGESRRRLARYLLVFDAKSHAAFRMSWRYYGRFAEAQGVIIPMPIGGTFDPLEMRGREGVLCEGVTRLLARQRHARGPIRRETLLSLSWSDLAYAQEGLETITLTLGDGSWVNLEAWHATATIEPILRWSQPWATLVPRNELVRDRPFISARTGSADRMDGERLRKILLRSGYPRTPIQAAAFLAKRAMEVAQATQNVNAAHEQVNNEISTRIAKLAEPGGLEEFWARQFPEAEPITAVTPECVELLGAEAMMAWQRRLERPFLIAAAAELEHPGEHTTQLSAAVKAAAVGQPHIEIPPLPSPLLGGVAAFEFGNEGLVAPSKDKG